MQIKRALIVHRKSLYQIYVKEHKERSVQRAIRRRDKVALGLKQSHQAHQQSLASVQRTLHKLGVKVVTRWRAHFRSTRSFDLVISLGGDGTLLDASHRILDDTPLIGINSDPHKSVGALCCGTAEQIAQLVEALRSGELRPTKLSRIRIRIDGEEVVGPTLNDVLLAHVCPAGLTRFDMAIAPTEIARGAHSGRNRTHFSHHRGSGVWVATATGSTAAIRSAGGKVMRPRSKRLQYLIREPYVALGQPPPGLPRGFIQQGEALVLVSRLRRGMLWADGVYRNLHLDYGQQVVLDLHPAPLHLIRTPT